MGSTVIEGAGMVGQRGVALSFCNDMLSIR